MDKPSAKISLSAVICLTTVVLVVVYAVSAKLKTSPGGYFHIVRHKEAKPVNAVKPSSSAASEKIAEAEKQLNPDWKLDDVIKLHRLYKVENMNDKATQVLKDDLQREKNPVAIHSLLNWLVTSLVREQRFPEAELYARQAIQDENEKNAHPLELAQDYGLLGRILVKESKLVDARDAFEKVLRYRTASDTKPENWEAYRAYELEELGSIYCRLGEWKKAQPLLEEALKLHEKHDDQIATVWSLDCLKQIYATTGDKTRADECQRKLTEISESRPAEFAELERPVPGPERKISSESSQQVPSAR